MEFNEQEVLIDCSKCCKEIIVKILEIVRHDDVKCPHCGAINKLAANDKSAKLNMPETYKPFDGLDQYIKETYGDKYFDNK